MEYDFYLEQKYLYEERVEARILTAAQAEAMGYEDGCRISHADHKLYVDGFDSIDAIHTYLSGLAEYCAAYAVKGCKLTAAGDFETIIFSEDPSRQPGFLIKATEVEFLSPMPALEAARALPDPADNGQAA